MPRFDSTTAECQIFTFKEGLLSAVAHDLELRVERFEIDLAHDLADQETAIKASFDVRSIRVVDAIVDGRRAPGALSDKDKKKIESNIVKHVIGKRHATITFESTAFSSTAFSSTEASETEVQGILQLGGRSRDITVRVRQDGGQHVGEYRLHQPDFGLEPYSAMFGALKIKPEIRIVVKLPIMVIPNKG